MTQQNSLSNLIDELRRRRVFRVAAFYGGIAFVIVQIIDGTFDLMGVPQWVGRVMVTLLALGFPISMVLAWVFDITPEGIVRTEGTASPTKQQKPGTSNSALIVVAIAAVAFGIWGRWGTKDISPDSQYNIAVLYFENLTGDPDMEWIEAGMVEMLTANLGQVPGLKIVSSQRIFDILSNLGSNQRIVEPAFASQVASEAGAATMLLGSVMGSGSNLRISTQLVDVSSGDLIVSNVLNGKANGTLFDLADSLALRTVANLGLEKTIPAKYKGSVYTLTSSTIGLKHYISGIENLNRSQFELAINDLKIALSFDSTFAMAWYNLGLASSWADVDGSSEAYQAANRNKEYLSPRERRLVELEVIETLGEKKIAYEQFLQDYPDDKYAWYMYGELTFHSYFLPSAYRAFGNAINLDKHFLLGYDHLVGIHILNRKYVEATDLIEKGLALDSTNLAMNFEKAIVLSGLGKYTEALDQFSVVKRMVSDEPDNVYHFFASVGSHALKDEFLLVGNLIEEYIDRHSASDRSMIIEGSASKSRTGHFWASHNRLKSLIEADSETGFLFIAGMLSLKIGDLDDGVRRGEQILAKYESGIEPFVETATMGHYLLYLVARELGEANATKTELDALIALTLDGPHDMDLYTAYVMGLEDLEVTNFDEAINIFRSIIEDETQGPMSTSVKMVALPKLARALFENGDYQELVQIDLLLQIPYHNIGFSNPAHTFDAVEFYLIQVNAHIELGQPEEARLILESILAEWDNPDEDLPIVQLVHRKYATLLEAIN